MRNLASNLLPYPEPNKNHPILVPFLDGLRCRLLVMYESPCLEWRFGSEIIMIIFFGMKWMNNGSWNTYK